MMLEEEKIQCKINLSVYFRVNFRGQSVSLTAAVHFITQKIR